MMNCLKLSSVILAGLWFAACAHTSAPETTKPQEEKAKQTPTESSAAQEAPEKPPADQAASQETATDKQKQASGKSQSSREASQETAGDEQKQTSEKTPTGQAASQETDKDAQNQAADKADSSQAAAGTAKTPDTKTAQEGSAGAAGTQSKATEKSASSRRADSPETADSKLAEARRNLRISEATEKRIAAELEQLKKSGAASPETIKNYETYHESVQGMVAENRKIVAQMEAAKARHPAGEKSSETTGGGQLDNMLDPAIPEAQTTDEVAVLDRQLNASLNEFDARLLKEMDAIRDDSAEKMRDLAQDAAEAAKRLREKGVDVNTSGSESSEASAATQTQAEQGAKGSKTASTDSSRQSGQGSSREEQGRVGSEDDDIVARQLREAAENETDPELKEKLWKEYDEYKKN
jgi:hypothetical protein